jgi:ribosome-binding protein aMBF1 (putative translation factor)
LEKEEMHLVKKVSKELGLTYKELGEEIGYSESNLKRSVSTKQISSQLEKAIELYLKIIKLEQEINRVENLKSTLKELIFQ